MEEIVGLKEWREEVRQQHARQDRRQARGKLDLIPKVKRERRPGDEQKSAIFLKGRITCEVTSY